MIVGTSFLTIFWSLLVAFFMITFFLLLFQVIGDLFRRHDASGGKKALWVMFLVLFPYLGLIVYYITNAPGMAERQLGQVRRSQEQFDDYVRGVAGGSADQIEKAKQLLDSGAISQAEFETLKTKALA